jgi:predicted phage terminase large subunit-like protein
MSQNNTITIEGLKASILKDSLEEFVKEFWGTVVADEIIWEPHMTLLCELMQEVIELTCLRPDPLNPERKIRLQKLHDLIINIPPGTSKSTICTIMAPAWAWTRDPSLRIITGSYSADLATEHSVKSRDIIKSDTYRKLFPYVVIKADKDLKTNYETTSMGQRFATSVGGTVTGVHAHIIIIDDPINPKQAASQADVKSANDWIGKTLSTRKADKAVTVTILVMQRLAVNDPTGNLLGKKKQKIEWICLPGELSDLTTTRYRHIYKEGLLSPRRLGIDVLAEMKVDLGSAGYAGQVAQRPAPEGGTVWQSQWFIQVPDEMFPDINKASLVANDWDLAYSKEEINSASAYFTSGVVGENIFVFDFGWKWNEFPEQIKWMKEIGWPHYIENKGPGKSAKQTLKKGGVVAIEVKVNRDKIARAKDAAPTAEAGHVYIKKSMADRLFNDQKQGILFFPNGEHNDLADALSQMLVRRTKKGIVVSNTTAPEQSSSKFEQKENPLDWVGVE